VQGLDSYNAYNVVESLKDLAKTYNRTVIFTIHQPQSNIVALFDRLLLLAKGQLVYSGEAERAPKHFEKIGHECPKGYNIADYLIDLTVEASGDHRTKGKDNGHIAPVRPTASNGHRDPESGFASRAADSDGDSEAYPKPDDTVVGGIKKKAQQLLGAFSSPQTDSGTATPQSDQIPEKLASLVLANRASDDAKILEAEINRIQSGSTPDGHEGRRDLEEMRAYKKATYWTQFSLLSQRAFKNLYR
jgi:ABC-type multidrug transport system ATPase subunit